MTSTPKIAPILLIAGSLTLTACDLDLLAGLDGDLWGGRKHGVFIDEIPLLAVGDALRLEASYYDSQASDPIQGTFTWFSGDPAVLAVEENGVARARLPGWTGVLAVHDSTRLWSTQLVRIELGQAAATPASFRALTVGAVACGADAEGAASCWGPVFPPWTPLGLGVGGRSTAMAIRHEIPFASMAAGESGVCGLAADGSAYCWGEHESDELDVGHLDLRNDPAPVAGNLAFRALSVGAMHSCGITLDGSAYCWGAGRSGQLGNGTTGPPSRAPVPVAGGVQFVQIDVGYTYTCGIDVDSLAWCWGSNEAGQLGNGTREGRESPALVAGGHRFAGIATLPWGQVCALESAGHVYCWGSTFGSSDHWLEPRLLDDSRAYARIAGGGSHFCLLTESGEASCFGENWVGQIGDGTTELRLDPVPVSEGLRFTTIAAGHHSTCGLTDDGTAYCWGANDQGLLGTGTFESSSTPVRVVTLD